jgi:hypothetical protein
MKRLILALLFLVASFMPLFAAEAEYGSLVRQGHAALMAGDKGRAAYLYEKALVISDASPVVRQNLATLRQECGADQYATPVHPLVKYVFFMYHYCTRSDLIGMMYFASLALLLFMGMTLFSGKKIAWLTNIVYGALMVFILLSCAFFFYRDHELGERDRARLLSPAPLFARADTKEEPLMVLAESSGVRVAAGSGRVNSFDSGMCKIILPNGVSGYVPCQAIAFIHDE